MAGNYTYLEHWLNDRLRATESELEQEISEPDAYTKKKYLTADRRLLAAIKREIARRKSLAKS